MTSSQRGAALAVLAALFAAGFLIAFQAATREAPRDAAVLAMLACSVVVNSGVAIARHRSTPAMNRTAWVTVGVLAVATVIGNIGVAGALARIDAGLTSSVLQTQLLFVALGGRIFLAESISGRFIMGMVLALVGFAVLGLGSQAGSTLSANGVLFAILAAASFSFMLVWTRAVIDRIDPVLVNAIRLAVAVAFMACLPGLMSQTLELSGRVWLFAGIAAVTGPFASRLCLMYALRYISASRTKLLSELAPVFAFILAFFVYGAVPGMRDVLGAGLILLGVTLGTLQRREILDLGPEAAALESHDRPPGKN